MASNDDAHGLVLGICLSLDSIECSRVAGLLFGFSIFSSTTFYQSPSVKSVPRETWVQKVGQSRKSTATQINKHCW